LRILIITAAVLCMTAGCIERTMSIKTDPPGAAVFVDGDARGQTPVEVPFQAYGTREIFLQMTDRATRRELVTLRAPWYGWFPVDFVTDVLWPFTIRDTKTFTFAMEPLAQQDMKELGVRGNAFSEKAKQALADERKKRGMRAQAVANE